MTRGPKLDQTLRLALEGYAWLPNLRRRIGDNVVRTTLFGGPAVGLCGPEAARFVYDERHVRRHGALPKPVLSTLFGKGAVHTLDGEAHRVRKAMFTGLMTPDGTEAGAGVAAGVARLGEHVGEAWDAAVPGWRGRGGLTVFADVPAVITAAVCRWAGVPLAGEEVGPMATALMALVDGFATAGPRHWRARRARGRIEARFADLIDSVRDGRLAAPAGSAVRTVAEHRDADGRPLDRAVAAVELLNVVRPTVAVTWFVMFAGHTLHRWPEHRAMLAGGDGERATAFAQEVRRFYPFAPFVGGRAARDLTFRNEPIPSGAMVLLDVYGQNHDPSLWHDPYAFRPDRFVGRPIGEFDLIPQGGGDPRAGHRCPGEAITLATLTALAGRLARLDHRVPEQDLRIPLHRIPARVTSGFRLSLR
ncbi:cytochrome P450 [Plantactinospora siamensis]|uniref:Cytochrome P450 n=1 Tax=Plantactinospora siamensis TaxID=555372 RepID=A0ABV6NQ84_9ACTN